jgi:hypothetical protein
MFPWLLYLTDAPITVHCTRSQVSNRLAVSTTVYTWQTFGLWYTCWVSAWTLWPFGHSACRITLIIRAQVTYLLVTATNVPWWCNKFRLDKDANIGGSFHLRFISDESLKTLKGHLKTLKTLRIMSVWFWRALLSDDARLSFYNCRGKVSSYSVPKMQLDIKTRQQFYIKYSILHRKRMNLTVY